MARRDRHHPGARRGRLRRRDRRLAVAAGLSGRFHRDPWSTTRAATAPPRVAHEAAAALGAGRPADRTVRDGRCRPAGPANSGRSSRALRLPQTRRRRRDYLLLTDADIVYAPDALTPLVARAEAGGLVLTSLMAKLRCKSFAERMFVPAFIFFFQMLYPFAWANDPRRATAAAAGGCMLVRRDALDASRRRRRDPRRPDRRLRARQAAQAPRADLAHADRARAQYPRLSGDRGHPPHGVAHRLCATALFAAAACWHRSRPGADLSRAGSAGVVRRRRGAIHRHFSSGC